MRPAPASSTNTVSLKPSSRATAWRTPGATAPPSRKTPSRLPPPPSSPQNTRRTSRSATQPLYGERMEAIVIGAGPAGLSAAAMLSERGVEPLVLERDSIASSWRRRYDRLHLHTWRLFSGLPGYRPSRERGPWISRDGVVEYLEGYARHHGVQVRTGVEVLRVERADGGWRVVTAAESLEAPVLVVATGYEHTPWLPPWPGLDSYEGELIHGSQYRNAEAYAGRDVLVVGTGNTGAEVVVDL